MTTEQIRELVEEDGLNEEEARLRLRDGDLWLLRPSARFDEDLQGEEGVRLWEEAAKVAQTVADAVSNGPSTIQASPAVTMLVWDAAERAEEALRQARQRVEEEDVHITPTVLYRIDQDGERLTAAAVEKPEKGRALIVFRSEKEAEKYRADTGNNPEEEGFKPVSVDSEDLANIIAMHSCTHVAMPEPWTGEGNVDFFAADDFVGMLRESVSA